MTLVQANARVPEAGRAVLVDAAARMRADAGFIERLRAFLAVDDSSGDSADWRATVERRLADLEGERRKEAYEALHPETRANDTARWIELTEAEDETAGATCAGSLSDGRRKGPQHQPNGINAASRELGIERTEAQHVEKVAAPVESEGDTVTVPPDATDDLFPPASSDPVEPADAAKDIEALRATWFNGGAKQGKKRTAAGDAEMERLLASGATNTAIMERMGVSRQTANDARHTRAKRLAAGE